MSQLADVNIQSSVGMFTFSDVVRLQFPICIKVALCCFYITTNVLHKFITVYGNQSVDYCTLLAGLLQGWTVNTLLERCIYVYFLHKHVYLNSEAWFGR